jgi:hypothetical protein
MPLVVLRVANRAAEKRAVSVAVAVTTAVRAAAWVVVQARQTEELLQRSLDM